MQLICQQDMNDLLTIIKVGQQRSRLIRLNIITARRFLASKNQFQLAKKQGVTGVLGSVKYVMNDLITITEVGQQRS